MLLQEKNWLDANTLGVFVEFSVWNPAINTICVVMLVFERTLVGDIVKHDNYIRTLNIIHNTAANDVFMGILRCIHCLFVFFYARTLIMSLVHLPIFGMMYELIIRHKMELMIISTAMLSWCFCVAKMWEESSTKYDFIKRQKTGFLNWYYAVYYNDLYVATQGICLFMTICNLLQLPWFYRFTRMIQEALNILWKMSLTGVVCLMGLMISGYYRFCSQSHSFQTVQRSLLSIVGFMVRELEYDTMLESHDFK